MFILGLDFDNTIVCYDGVFQKVAIEEKMVPAEFANSKIQIRDYLRKIDKEHIWTELQGYVYGKRMNEAKPFPGVLDFLRQLKAMNIKVYIVSHRTKYPFLGPKYDLHNAAKQWLELQKFHDPQELILPSENVFFELSKADKIKRIIDLRCTHYVDDLPEILEMLPKKISKILFANNKVELKKEEWRK